MDSLGDLARVPRRDALPRRRGSDLAQLGEAQPDARDAVLIDAVTAVVVVLGAAVGYELLGISGAAVGGSVAMVGGAVATAALARRRLGFWPLSLPELRNLLKHSLLPRLRPSGR